MIVFQKQELKAFPEYADVVFPLTKEMDFEIIPTAGWTLKIRLLNIVKN